MDPERPSVQSLRAQAEAKYESHSAALQQQFIEQERMSSYTDDAFECESPHAILTSSCGVGTHQHLDPQTTEGAGESSFQGVNLVNNLHVRGASDHDAHGGLVYGDLAQPRPEIILRRKRFAVLVVITAAVMSAIAAWLREGFVVEKRVPVVDAETKTDMVNSYIGLMMGFIESIIALGIEEIFPVFVVYLHNLRWYPGDDPATKKQSKLKKFALTIFIPAVMMAVSSSLSAVQANQKEDNSVVGSSNPATTTRFLSQQDMNLGESGLGDTILKTALARKVEPMQPVKTSRCPPTQKELFTEDTLLAASPKVIFGFPVKDWSIEFGNEWPFQEETQRCEISYNSAGGFADEAYMCEIMPLAMACDLWAQGKAHFFGSPSADIYSKLDSRPSSMGELFDHVVNSLLKAGLPLIKDANVDASFETRALSPSMKLQVMTLELPLRSTTNTTVVCSETSCSLLVPYSNAKLRFPRKQAGMAPGNTSNSVFVHGLTVVNSFNFEAAVVKRSLVLSFGRITWHFAQADKSECGYATSTKGECQVLHHQLGNSNRRLVLAKQWLPPYLQRESRNFHVSLVQLLEPKVRLHPGQLMFMEHLKSWPKDFICSATLDPYLRYIKNNHFYFNENVVETMAASALLYIFQNAKVVYAAHDVEAVNVQRQLVDTRVRRVRIFLTNTKVGNVCTWTGCGVLLLLTILVFVLPNERARLAPPRGGNARAERFVAVQTEQIYPNLIYKKRFLIGKTGEEIKFGEFVVESVGLHHRMEEDEQIFI
ncbi:uncharacterized protein PHALS_08460 [Plasmopara halstedii]|uniref:Transmembrane protein n=1 Tax=Plasmopara halstedii TaxID=4781 RepID=A0A0P1ACE0_PLAHL|nr:uncharacterized protein PHALS_08460 [Plasmopara halstedii]CEG38382.1 hypothetical protein PHALS_08460 [Plasmopara halstedii]|eukprot:XP_024574751.1 hypothetical protein PHALS_08460 [Plasmopara halstedii]